jgi:hypothetical protein
MTAPTPRKLPKYRHYKPKDLAVVRIDGRDYYLGKYDSPLVACHYCTNSVRSSISWE